MEETMETGFEDFASALSGDDYQISTDEETEATGIESTEEEAQEDVTASEAVEEPDTEDNSESTDASESDEVPAEEKQTAEKTESESMFVIKVNKEERKVTREEMTQLAQKGADYDRVKEQLATARTELTEAKASLDGQKGIMEILDTIAEKSGVSIEQLAETLYVNFRKNGGATEGEAKAELAQTRAEKALAAEKAKNAAPKEPSNEERAQKDIAEFRSNYPDVELTDDLLNSLMADVQNGMSLTNAYQKKQIAEQAQRIKELEAQSKASAQNAKNRKKSPGSMNDSGGSNSNNTLSSFKSALFG